MGYLLRELAREDLEQIWVYTRQEWGADQADDYVRALLSRMEWLGKNPHSGKCRQDIKAGYFCYPEGRHLIFYVIGEHQIEIIGVPHQSMDVVSHLDSDP